MNLFAEQRWTHRLQTDVWFSVGPVAGGRGAGPRYVCTLVCAVTGRWRGPAVQPRELRPVFCNHLRGESI